MNVQEGRWKWRTWNELLRSQRKIKRSLLAAVLLSLLVCVCPRFLSILLLAWSFLGGICICYLAFRPDSLLPNLLKGHTRIQKVVAVDEEFTLLRKLCPVCGKVNCKQHRPELNVLALQPWANLELPEKVNAALDEFLNLVLKEFVYTWYRDLSKDEAFVDELRTSLRFIAAVLIRRLQKVDLPSVIIKKILPIAMQHLHFFLEARKLSGVQMDMEEHLLRFYGRNLHIAVRNRQTELDYLRSISQRLFLYILPVQSLKCRGLCVLLREILSAVILLPVMDLIASPDTINILLRLFLDKTPAVKCVEPPSNKVAALAAFVTPSKKGNSCLHLKLTSLLENATSLYAFMQFMRAEASVNVLQFYLTVEQFNNKLLCPELGEMELHDLQHELCDLYTTYCDPNSSDHIQFTDDISSQLKAICDGPPEGIIILQTSTPLFKAYEHTYELLEKTFLPLFHQSDDYYKMLCGERLPTRMQRNMPRAATRMVDLLTLSKLGSKIKNVFKNNTVDGSVPDIDYTADEADEADEAESEDLVLGGGRGLRRGWEGPLHDLSAWRVTVPELIAAPEPDNPRRSYAAFLVEVRRVDVLENDFEASRWSVERRYHEFYALEQKLVEFHGDFDGVQLPPKKSFGTKSIVFLETRRAAFEQYLQRLLTMPNLRGSELLYSFFTSDYEFSTNFLPDINLGKVLNSTAVRLVMKEKGQHLDPFLQSLLQSTETSKSRPCKWSDKDSDTVSLSSEKMANSMFDNNANTDLSLPDLPPSQPLLRLPIEDAFDTLLYLVHRVYAAPRWLLRVLLSLRIIAKRTLDIYLDFYLHYKLGVLLDEAQVVKLIHLVRDAIFFDNEAPRSDEVKKETKDSALSELMDYIPKLFVTVIGQDRHKNGTKLVFDVLQHPKLNKQLSYMLLDDLLQEFFPELVEPQQSPTSPRTLIAGGVLSAPPSGL